METHITKNQFGGFMPRGYTMEMSYLLWRLMERDKRSPKGKHMIFINLVKTYDIVPREVLWKASERKGVYIVYIRAIKDIYNKITTSVRT